MVMVMIMIMITIMIMIMITVTPLSPPHRYINTATRSATLTEAGSRRDTPVPSRSTSA